MRARRGLMWSRGDVARLDRTLDHFTIHWTSAFRREFLDPHEAVPRFRIEVNETEPRLEVRRGPAGRPPVPGAGMQPASPLSSGLSDFCARQFGAPSRCREGGRDGRERPAMIGKTVGHYRITARLGAGGMGEVFLAEDTRLDRKAAIKFLPAEWAGDPERRQRIRFRARRGLPPKTIHSKRSGKESARSHRGKGH